ncbi:MAG: AraC family transcriptional regulator [Spirochaetota bacterium]
MTFSDYSSAISLISFGVSIFLSLMLFFSHPKKLESLFLATFLAIFSLTFLLRYSFTIGSVLVVYLPFLTFPMVQLQGPLLQFYTRSVLFGETIAFSSHWPFSLPPLSVLTIHTFLFVKYPEFSKQKSLLIQTDRVMTYTNSLVFLFGFYNLFFIIRAWSALKEYQYRYREQHASIERERLSWLRAFLCLNMAICFIYIVLALSTAFINLQFPVTPLEGTAALAMNYLVLYYLIRKPEIFSVSETLYIRQTNKQTERTKDIIKEPTPQTRKNVTKATAKYSRQSLAEKTRKKYLTQIQSYMKTERPYLNEELSLHDIAEATGIPVHHFSMVINIELEQNFFHFVNSYRVQEAQRLLANPQLADQTILRIAFDAGFQSKAAFNKIFKKQTGITPGEFRKLKK